MATPRPNPAAKLTPALVIEVRRLAASREPHRVIAGLYGVSAETVARAARRETWRHVPASESRRPCDVWEGWV